MSEEQLAPIPNKTYFTIGEVSKLCGVQETVLRYWQERFRQLNPVRRRGRRYYQKKDIELIRRIRDLLYVQGYTINGAKKALIENEPMAKIINSPVPVPAPQEIPVAVPVAPVQQPKQEVVVQEVQAAAPAVPAKKSNVKGLLAELQGLLTEIK